MDVIRKLKGQIVDFRRPNGGFSLGVYGALAPTENAFIKFSYTLYTVLDYAERFFGYLILLGVGGFRCNQFHFEQLIYFLRYSSPIKSYHSADLSWIMVFR